MFESIIQANRQKREQPLIADRIDKPVEEKVVSIVKSRPNVVLTKDSEAYSSTDINKSVYPEEEEVLIKSVDADAWVYAAIYRIASAVASVQFEIEYMMNDGSLRNISSEPEFKVFKTPNEWFTRFDFWESTTVYLESVGRAFWELVKGPSGIVEELYPLKPSHMKPIKDRKKFIVGWEYTLPNRNPIKFSNNEIAFLRYIHPDNPYIGQSPLRPGSTSVAIDVFAQNYSLSFFKNSGRPDGLLIYDSELNDEDYERIRKNWDKTHGSISKAHRIAIVEQGMDYKQISTTQKDAEFIKQRKLSRDEILAVFGVPPATVGVFESAIKANAEVQERMFWTETMLPKLIKMAEAVKLAIIPMILSTPELKNKYDINRIHTSFDTSKVYVLMQIIREHQDQLIQEVKDSIISRNEARKILEAAYGIKLPPFEGGDDMILPQNVSNNIGTVTRTENEKKSNLAKAVSLKLIKQEDIEVGLNFELDSPEAINVLNVKPMLVKTVEESNEIIRGLLVTGIAENKNLKDIQAEIWDRFNDTDEFSINRTTTIARTETTQVANSANLDAYKQSGVVDEKTWLTSRDLKVRPATKFDKGDHRILDGESRKLDDTFSNGLMYPGDQSGKPEENIMCRCTTLSKTSNIVNLATSSNNDILLTVLWKKFVRETERYEVQIKDLFLEFFELQGSEYIKNLNSISLSKSNIDLIMLDVDAVSNGMEEKYKPLKTAIFKEQGTKELSKLTI